MTRTGHAYTPEKTRSYEGKMALFGHQAMRGKPPLQSPLHVGLLVILPMAESWSKKKKEAALKGEMLPVGRRDLDNFIKCLDGLNGIVWKDDGQICSISARKIYGQIPGLHIIVEELDSCQEAG